MTIEAYLNQNNLDAFFDFSSGVDIGDAEIMKRIIELVKLARHHGVTGYISIASGNCKVNVFYDADEQRADITVSKNHKEAHIYFKEDGIIDTGGIPLKVDPNTNKWIINYTQIWDH